MAQFKLYRHPQHGVAAIRAGDLLASLRGLETSLLREGYRDVGIVDARNEREAIAKATPVGSLKPPGLTSASPRYNVPHGNQGPAMLMTAVIFFLVMLAAMLLVWRQSEEDVATAPELTAPVAADVEFTPWMSFDETDVFAKQIDTKTYRVTAVEGRWQDNERQCRVRLGPVPKVHHRWYWWCSQSESRFEELKKKNAKDGFSQIQQQAYSDGDGTLWISGVWHKEETTDTP